MGFFSATSCSPTKTAAPIWRASPEQRVEFDIFGGDYLFNLDFEPISDVSSFTLDYEVAITDPNKFFTAVDLDSTVNTLPGGPNEFLEATYSFANGNSPMVLISEDGIKDADFVDGRPTVMNVSNSYNSNGGQIDSFQNSFQQGTEVPGPLPVLGAGVAFGFSRKLRRRIDGARVKA